MRAERGFDSHTQYQFLNMSTIRIPVPLRKLVGGGEIINTFGKSLGECLELLCLSYPDIKERIFDENGEIRRFINIFVNDEDIRFLQNKETPIQATDEISIVPAIAGG
jgi:molybdopterin synthase sulfur carrier subunit